MTYTSPHRPDRAAPKLPSEIAVTPPRRKTPVYDVKPGQIFTDWAAI